MAVARVVTFEGVGKDRIAELQNAINASKQMYAAACSRLGLNNDLEDEEGGES